LSHFISLSHKLHLVRDRQKKSHPVHTEARISTADSDLALDPKFSPLSLNTGAGRSCDASAG